MIVSDLYICVCVCVYIYIYIYIYTHTQLCQKSVISNYVDLKILKAAVSSAERR